MFKKMHRSSEFHFCLYFIFFILHLTYLFLWSCVYTFSTTLNYDFFHFFMTFVHASFSVLFSSICSSFCRKAKTTALIISQISQWIMLNKYAATTCWFVKARSTFFYYLLLFCCCFVYDSCLGEGTVQR